MAKSIQVIAAALLMLMSPLFAVPTHAQANLDITGFVLFREFCAPGQSCTIVGTMTPGIAVIRVLGGDAGNFITTMQVVQLTGVCPNLTPEGQVVSSCPFIAETPAIPTVRWAGYQVVEGGNYQPVDVTNTLCFDPLSSIQPRTVFFK